MIAVDGSELSRIVALFGPRRAPMPVDAIERAVGRSLPRETRALLGDLPVLRDPDAEGHPEIETLDFFAGLPDVDAWLARLATGLEGPFLACCHFFGLVPIAVRLDRGDFTYALAAIEPYADGLGGVFYYDERELGRLAPTASQFLASELRAFFEAGDDPHDCYHLDTTLDALPDFAPIPASIDAAFTEHAAARSDGRSRWWICAALRGEIASWALDAIPTPERWESERARVGQTYGDTMFWLLAHAILGNRPELADAIERSRAHPSPLVAALRTYVDDSDFVNRHGEYRAGLYELAGRVEI